MQHPSNFLSRGEPLTPDTWFQLIRNCNTVASSPDEDQITFHFNAQSIADNHDMVIVANRSNGSFNCMERPHCACQEHPLDCQCVNATCHSCKLGFVAFYHTCDSAFCINDECPLCKHQRESCLFEDLRSTVQQEAQRIQDETQGSSLAMAHVAAVAEVLAPGVGDAPIFPATVRILNELLPQDQDDAPGPDSAGRRLWHCQDGSTVLQDPNSPGWLTWEEQPPAA